MGLWSDRNAGQIASDNGLVLWETFLTVLLWVPLWRLVEHLTTPRKDRDALSCQAWSLLFVTFAFAVLGFVFLPDRPAVLCRST